MLAGFSRDDLHAAQFCILSISGHLWHRCVQPFQRFPHKLAVLCDPNERDDDKQALVHVFVNAHPCCLDAGYSQRLKAYLQAGMLIRFLHELFQQLKHIS